MYVMTRNSWGVAAGVAISGVLFVGATISYGDGCSSSGCNDNCFVFDKLIVASGQYKDWGVNIARRGCNSGTGVNRNPAGLTLTSLSEYNNGTTSLNCSSDSYPGPGTGSGGTLIYTDSNANAYTRCGTTSE